MRLSVFLILSCALHTAFICSLPAMSTSPAIPLKKPIWVELFEVKESISTKAAPDSPGHSSPFDTVKKVQPKPKRSVSPKTLDTPLPKRASGKKLSPPSVKPDPSRRRLADLHPDMENDLSFNLRRDGRELLPDEIEYDKYLAEIKRKVLEIKRRVENNWKKSLDAEVREGTTVLVAMVKADGSLWSIDIVKPSGMILHDYEALESVKKVFPLRPPPKTLLTEKGKLPIRFSVHYLLHSPS